MHQSSNLSPRRVKPAPAIVLYELRLLRVSVKPTALLPLFEARAKRWRGVLRWALHAFTSGRAEVVLQVIVERLSVARVDNLFATWRRTLSKVLGKACSVPKLKRAEWLPMMGDSGGSVMADVRVLFDAFDSGCAKLWADTLDPAAVRCSYLEPALPLSPQAQPAVSVARAPLQGGRPLPVAGEPVSASTPRREPVQARAQASSQALKAGASGHSAASLGAQLGHPLVTKSSASSAPASALGGVQAISRPLPPRVFK